MALDLVLPKKKLAPGERNDESLESFVVRRMGRESLDRLAEPLVGGVNGSDPKDMSLAATYPMLLDMEQQHGSLVRGFLAQRKKVEEMKAQVPAQAGCQAAARSSARFTQGLQFLTDRMADAAGREHITHRRRRDGDLARGRRLVARDARLRRDARPATRSSWPPRRGRPRRSLRGVDARIAELVASIPCSSSATILMGFDEADCPFDKHWHGILSPAVEHEPVTGISLMSSKWPDRAPEGRVLLRGFVGGPRDQEIIKRSDDELIEIARSSFVRLLGVKAGCEAGLRAGVPLGGRHAAVHDGAPRPRRRDRGADRRDSRLGAGRWRVPRRRRAELPRERREGRHPRCSASGASRWPRTPRAPKRLY